MEVNEDEAGLALQGEAGNLWVKIPASVEAETILFAAHMDTVGPGEGIQAIIEDGVIKSKGNTILGSDDKAAIAALLEALDVIREKRLPHGPLELLFTVGEEQGLQGAKQFDFTSLKATMAYVLMPRGIPGYCNTITLPNEIEYKVYGKLAHGINPKRVLMPYRQQPWLCPECPADVLMRRLPVTWELFRRDSPQYCSRLLQIKGEARSLNRSRLDQITQTLKTPLWKKYRDKARAEVEVKFLYPEIRLDPEDRVVKTAVKAIESTGLQPRLESTGGGSDASIIHGNGIPCVNLGIGMSNVHSCDEYIKISHLIKDTKIILAIINEIIKEK